MYLYRAVDSSGNTVDFWLSMNRDKKSARKFLKRILCSPHNSMPQVITTYKYPATEIAILEEQYYGCLSCRFEHRMVKYLNNIIEAASPSYQVNHNSMLGFKNFNSACFIIAGVETLHMINKGQAGTSCITEEVNLINQLLGVA